MKELKLNFEILPTGAFYFNLRSTLSKKAWDIIRFDAYKRANGKCSVCGKPTSRLEAHEQWEFIEKTKTQKLNCVIAVCSSCHSVIHINRTILVGKEDSAIKHFEKVNGVDYSTYINSLKEANDKANALSYIYDWSLDLKWLKRFIDEN